MKPSSLQAGRTYVGKGGRRRYLREIHHEGFGPQQKWHLVYYDVPEGGTYDCYLATFARWAEREAEPEESET